MATNYRVSRGFASLNDSGLETFGDNIVEGMTDNPAFPTPLVPMPVFTATVSVFRQAVTAGLNGGKVEIAQRQAARAALLSQVRQLAAYVEGVAGEDLPTLLSSGFQTVNMNRTRIPLPKPVVVGVDSPQSQQLLVRVEPVPTARAYEVRMSFGTSGWQSMGIFTQARRILLDRLTPGTIYTVQARAFGGTTGSSEWSDSVSHMAT